MTITKNRQSDESIRLLVKNAYPEKEMKSCTELTEGLCNVAYRIAFADGSRRILKIAAADKKGYMTNEINLMEAEVSAMGLAQKALPGLVAKVDLYDSSKKLCNGSYFFMEVLEGENYVCAQNSYSEEEKEKISFSLGNLVCCLAGVTGEAFGLIGDKTHRFATQYELTRYMLSNVIADADRAEVKYFVSGSTLLDMLDRDMNCFKEVEHPVLVHYDLWEGNVFVKDKEVSGLIDWERALWGDVLMEDRFRRHTRNAAFLRGYGQETFTEAQQRRILWYDMILYLTMMTEGKYRQYEDDSQYRWIAPLFEASLGELQSC